MDLRPDMLARALLGNVPENDAVSYAKQLQREADKKALVQALGQTWPAQMAKSAVGAAALPGDVYAGRVDPMSQQGIERAADLAGFVTMGSFAAPRPAGSVGMGGRPDKPQGIRAYHGSPHDFDRFDMSKIGTGEGAQAYGHGLYFAEAEPVAKGYRDALAGAGKIETPRGNFDTSKKLARINKKYGDELAEEVRENLRMVSTGEISLEDAKRHWMWQATRSDYGRDVYTSIFRDAQGLKNTGRMYEVNIRANPDDFLDWDKPLREQGTQVRQMLTGIFDDSTMGSDIVRLSQDDARTRAIAKSDLPNTSMPASQMQASEGLRQPGIPGIKYLDQGSRAAGGGSRNYVVFDDSLIEIIRKYGLLGMMGTGAAAGAYATQAPTQGNGT